MLDGSAGRVSWSALNARANRDSVVLVMLARVGGMQSIGGFAEWRISGAWHWRLMAALQRLLEDAMEAVELYRSAAAVVGAHLGAMGLSR
ncbi:hypothetical protein ASF90_19830 [Xanthomonas sp. Leaf148]|nr:hypothetical protein ASF90_19830 [Xanthomonas sp. Leaf148]